MSDTGKTRGACVFCGKELTRGGMSRHLQSCEARSAAIRKADERAGPRETLLHLLAQDAPSGQFWLHLEMRASAPLKELDAYLRAIWLECCGHLSQFSRGEWGGQEIEIGRRIGDVLGDGGTLTHVYDFGESSVTLVKAVDVREGRPLTRHPIHLMARNGTPPHVQARVNSPRLGLCGYSGPARPPY